MREKLRCLKVLVCVGVLLTLSGSITNVQAASNKSVEELQAKFPAGTYWNHAGSSINNPDGYTFTPCSHHGNCSKGGTDYSGWCGCNSFGSSIQCFGFANKLAYDAYGSYYTSWSKSSLDSLKPGDVIRYKNDGHSIFVTGVSGNTITYGDCNSDGRCIIRWNATISKSTVAQTLTAVYSAPAELSGTSTTCTCSDTYAGQYTVTANGGLNLRASHNTGASVYVTIPQGTEVTVSKASAAAGQDGWAHVSYGGYSGYCSTFYLKGINTNNIPSFDVNICTGGLNQIYVKGWTYDPDAPSESLEVHVYVGGPAGSAGAVCHIIQADKFRSDVNEHFGISGNHGFEEYINVSAVGETEVYIYAINKPQGDNPIIGNFVVNITTDQEAPTISNVTISNVSSLGYTITCEVSDNVGINRVQFPTWTIYDWQDDLLSNWQLESAASGKMEGSTVTYRVNISEHNNETGGYDTHIYAYDESGNYGVYEVNEVNIENGYVPLKTAVYNNHIYAAFTEPLTWKEAEEKCEEMGGHLVTITSAEENKVVESLAVEGVNAYFIGATDEASEGTWTWVTGESFSYQSWNDNEPNDYNSNEDYSAIYVNRQWNDVSNNNVEYGIGFIMEIDSKFTPNQTVAYGDKVYELYDISMPWEIARIYCELWDSNLACVTTEEENVVIAKLAEQGELMNFYLGANDKDNEGTWTWVTGEKFLYNDWLADQPDNRSGDAVKGPENYLTYDTYSDGWSDAKGCLGSIGFIRERKNDLTVAVNTDLTIVQKGKKVTLTAWANGGLSEYTYSYLVYNKDTKTWARLSSAFTNSNTFTWTAGNAGTRVFYVEVKDGAGTVVRSEGITVNVVNPELVITGKVSETNIQKGGKIIITGTPTGGTGSYTYSYLVYNRTTREWARLTSSFMENNTFTWTAGSEGMRDFYVEVKDSAGKVVRSKALTVNVTGAELTIVGKSSVSTVQKGAKVTLTATATGGSGSYTYSYLVYNKTTGEWARLTPSFVKNNTFTWTAGSTGIRDFYVEVKDSTGKVVRSKAVTVTVAEEELTITGKSSASTVTKGSKVTITGNATGGNGSYTYSYLVYNKTTGEWARLTPSFIKSNTFTWTAGSTGVRNFYVEVKDSTGKVVRCDAISVNVK